MTDFEKTLSAYVEVVDKQRFDWQEDENGDLRQCWCPNCGEITAVIGFRCEHCEEWFTLGDIEDQFDKPEIRIPADVAWALYQPFGQILWGKSADEVFELKQRKNRARGEKRTFQKRAAFMVHQQIDSEGVSLNRAAKWVAERIADDEGYPDQRTIINWFRKFYPKE